MEYDHFPVPARHGGKHVVPACINCHDLKDRVRLDDLDNEIIAAWMSLGITATMLVARCFAGRPLRPTDLFDLLEPWDDYRLAERIVCARVITTCVDVNHEPVRGDLALLSRRTISTYECETTGHDSS